MKETNVEYFQRIREIVFLSMSGRVQDVGVSNTRLVIMCLTHEDILSILLHSSFMPVWSQKLPDTISTLLSLCILLLLGQTFLVYESQKFTPKLFKWLVPVIDLCISSSVVLKSLLYGIRVSLSPFRHVNICFTCSDACIFTGVISS